MDTGASNAGAIRRAGMAYPEGFLVHRAGGGRGLSQLPDYRHDPPFVLRLQDHITTDLRLLALAFFPAAGIESFVPSRLGYLSDRVGRMPLIIAGLAGAGLGRLLVPGIPHLPWLIVLWTLRAGS